MNAPLHVRKQDPKASPDANSNRRGQGLFAWGVRSALCLLIVLMVSPAAWSGVNLHLVTAPGGITITSVGQNYSSSFGAVNALGVGAPAAGVTVIPLSNGALYYSTYQLTYVGGLPAGQTAYVTAYASTNFGHPIALVLQSCSYPGSCTTSGQYAAISTSVAAPTAIIPAPGIAKAVTVTAGLAIFVPDNNGATAWTGTDSATITYTMINSSSGATSDVTTLSLNNPSLTLQSAVQMTLASAAGGLAISPATDYSANFGNVNAMGIGPAAGLTTVSATGGTIYATPFQYNVAFTGFNASSGSVTAYVSTNFVHPAVLALRRATALAGPYTNFSTSSATPTTLTNSAGNRSTATGYLGLFVSNINGPTTFSGADNATLTLTLTVP